MRIFILLLVFPMAIKTNFYLYFVLSILLPLLFLFLLRIQMRDSFVCVRNHLSSFISLNGKYNQLLFALEYEVT